MKVQKGFTLIELSLVIIIIGILIVAILTGKSLIESSKQTAIIASFSDYDGAYNAFKEKYNAIPGDFNDASNTFGCSGCNGDNDRLITYNVTAPSYENLYAWQQLALAGFVKGTYAGGSTVTLGSTVPVSPIDGAGFDIYSYSSTGSHQYAGNNAIVFGRISNANKSSMSNSVFSPTEAWELDSKMDDGTPYTGRLEGAKGDNAAILKNCVSSGTYNISEPNVICFMVYYFRTI